MMNKHPNDIKYIMQCYIHTDLARQSSFHVENCNGCTLPAVPTYVPRQFDVTLFGDLVMHAEWLGSSIDDGDRSQPQDTVQHNLAPGVLYHSLSASTGIPQTLTCNSMLHL